MFCEDILTRSQNDIGLLYEWTISVKASLFADSLKHLLY
jgi:hypothetical protein